MQAGRCSKWSAGLIVRDTSADVHVTIVDEEGADSDADVGAVCDTAWECWKPTPIFQSGGLVGLRSAYHLCGVLKFQQSERIRVLARETSEC